MSTSRASPFTACSDNADTGRTSVPQVKQAVTREEYLAAFSLLYRCYRAEGYVDQHPGQIVYRPVYGVTTSTTLVARNQQGVALGTLTIVEDRKHALPIESEYFSETQTLRGNGVHLAEISGLAIAPQHRSHTLAIFNGLTRFTLQFAKWRGIHELLIAVHPQKEAFYGRRFGFVRYGSIRPYKSVAGHMAVACRLDLSRLRDTMAARVYNSHFAEAIAHREFTPAPMKPADHLYFCHRSGEPLDGFSRNGGKPFRLTA